MTVPPRFNTFSVQAASGVTIPPVDVTIWKLRLFSTIPPPADSTEKLYQLLVVAPAPFWASTGWFNASDVPIGVVPGPFVSPEIRMYSTAASTTVIATSRIVAMIGDTPRLWARRHAIFLSLIACIFLLLLQLIPSPRGCSP